MPFICISVGPKMLARIYFEDFNLEPSYDCWLDRLEIWELPPPTDNSTKLAIVHLGTYCGHQRPPLHIIHNDFKMVLISDRYDTFPGFEARLKYFDNV